MIAATAPTADAIVTVVVPITAVALLFLTAGAIGHLLEWWETRSQIPGLTDEQLADRGVHVWPAGRTARPPWPHDLASWEDLGYRHDDGEVVR